MRQLLSVVDEHASRETAKHVRSTMRANAQAGFWNGAAPPFGYRTYVAEMHGKKANKKLAIDEVEARLVEMIFRLAELGTGRSGPMGTKKIAEHLNAAGYRTRAGKLGHVGPLQKILTNLVYKSAYVYNRRDSRAGKHRSIEERVEVACPAIIDPGRFDAVQALLKSRNPKCAIEKPPSTAAKTTCAAASPRAIRPLDQCPVLFRNGAPERIRTSDPQIRSLVLYPAELRAPREGT